MSLSNKIEKLIHAEDEKIEALQRVIKSHQERKKFLRAMIKVAEKVEGDEQ